MSYVSFIASVITLVLNINNNINANNNNNNRVNVNYGSSNNVVTSLNQNVGNNYNLMFPPGKKRKKRTSSLKGQKMRMRNPGIVKADECFPSEGTLYDLVRNFDK